MTEFLKKMGVPAIIAAILGALMTIVPIMFKLGERYAKEQQLTEEVVRLEGQINDLSIEVGKLAGSTQVLVTVMSAKQETARIIYREPVQTPAMLGNVQLAPKPTVTPAQPPVKNQQLLDISKSLESTQYRIREIQQSQQIKK